MMSTPIPTDGLIVDAEAASVARVSAIAVVGVTETIAAVLLIVESVRATLSVIVG